MMTSVGRGVYRAITSAGISGRAGLTLPCHSTCQPMRAKYGRASTMLFTLQSYCT